jgi:amino acid adenylation domain-containing protein
MNSRQAPVPPAPFVEFKIEDTRQTIAQRFEQQARHYADRLAVKYNQRALTYDELNGAANRVAHAIIKHGAREQAPIALVCGTALSTIVASLGALKAGKAFAPLDPRLPPGLAKRILASLESRIVLTDDKSSKLARELAASSKRINLDKLKAGATAENPRVKTKPDALAYINFTSGSTGAPKGVMWNHASELFGIRTKTNALHIVASDRISLLRANNVGAARDMFLALLNGAALITLDLDESGLASLAKWLRAEEVTIFSCVATIFRHALHGLSGNGNRFPAVRLIHIGGEPIFKADVELYKKCFSDDCLFVSRYSISETQAVSYFFIDKSTAIEDRVPVGYPLEGNEIAILDDAGKPAVPGEVGEIAVRSAYLAAGYWRQAELTKAKFLADPKGGAAHTYLTGDRGFQSPDGCLVHVGRKDFQAKIRGHRVEMTAVETALLHEVTSIKQAIVIARKDAAGGDRLIAYVVPRERGAVDAGGWRSHLKARLPDYMVPSAFVILDRVPVNAGGKIDRRALPEPSEDQAAFDARFVAPRTAVEKVLARFWSDALKIDRPGLGDDFTELGGDSLQAAQIVTRIQELFRLDQPLVTIAQASTIEELARLIVDHETVYGHSEKIAAAFLQVESLSSADVAAALQRYKNTANDG